MIGAGREVVDAPPGLRTVHPTDSTSEPTMTMAIGMPHVGRGWQPSNRGSPGSPSTSMLTTSPKFLAPYGSDCGRAVAVTATSQGRS